MKKNCENTLDSEECTSEKVVYALLTSYPSNGSLLLGSIHPSSTTKIELVGYKGEELKFDIRDNGVIIQWPVISINDMPCSHAWVLRITNMQAEK